MQAGLVDRLTVRGAKVTEQQMGVAKLTDQNTTVPESEYARVERERRYLLQDLPRGDAGRSACADHRQLHHRHTTALAQSAERPGRTNGQ